MDIEIIDQVNNHVKYGIIYTQEDLKDCLEREAKEVQPQVKTNGFRPGKVPIDYVIRMYGEKLRIQAMNKKITSDISDLIKENNYSLASQPVYNFKPRQETGDDKFYIELELFLMPTLPSLEYEKVDIKKYKPSEEAFQQILDKNLLMFQIMTADFDDVTDGFSEENDKVLFTLKVTAGDEEIASLGGQLQAIIGQEQAPSEIEAQIKGKKVGKKFTYTHQYAEDAENIFAPFLAGKEVMYDIEVNKIERPIIKELDEDKIQKIGFRDYDHLFEVLESNTHTTLENISLNKIKHDFFNLLQDAFKEVNIPDFIVAQEAHHIAMNEEAAKSNIDVMAEVTAGKVRLDINDAHKEKAQRSVRVGLFIRNYVKENNISVSDSEVKSEIEKHLQELTRLNAEKPDQKEKNYNDISLKAHTILLEDKVIESVLSRVNLIEEAVSKDDFFEKVKT